MRLQEKAKQVGFEWEEKEQVWKKVEEEIREMNEAIEENDPKKIEDEFGDVLFSMVNFARFINVDAENALELTNKKFVGRFLKMEALATAKGKLLNEMSLEEMDAIWTEIKQQRS